MTIVTRKLLVSENLLLLLMRLDNDEQMQIVVIKAEKEIGQVS